MNWDEKRKKVYWSMERVLNSIKRKGIFVCNNSNRLKFAVFPRAVLVVISISNITISLGFSEFFTVIFPFLISPPLLDAVAVTVTDFVVPGNKSWPLVGEQLTQFKDSETSQSSSEPGSPIFSI